MLHMNSGHDWYAAEAFDDIRAFAAVAEARPVSRAARELHLTQPAVSRRVQRLEAAIGAVLCDRRRRPFILTVAGRAALERCRRVLHAVRDVRSAAGGEDPWPSRPTPTSSSWSSWPGTGDSTSPPPSTSKHTKALTGAGASHMLGALDIRRFRPRTHPRTGRSA